MKGYKVFNPDWTCRDWLNSDARYLLNQIPGDVLDLNFDKAIFKEITGIDVGED